jgi:hypothetical protein
MYIHLSKCQRRKPRHELTVLQKKTIAECSNTDSDTVIQEKCYMRLKMNNDILIERLI